MATQVDKKIAQINQLRADGKISAAEATALRQQARAGANGKGDLNAAAEKSLRDAITKASTSASTGTGSGSTGTGTGTGGTGTGTGTGGTGTGTGTGGTGTGTGSGGSAAGKTEADLYIEKIQQAVASGQLTKQQGDSLIADVRQYAKGGNLTAAQRTGWNDDFRAYSEQNGFVKNAAGEWVKGGGGGTTGPPPPATTGLPPGTTQPNVQSCESIAKAPKGWKWTGEVRDGVSTCRLVEDKDAADPPTDYTNAKDLARKLFDQLGFNTNFGFTKQELDGFFTKIDSWITSGYADGDPSGTNLMLLIKSDKATRPVYDKRFPGMTALQQRGQAISEQEYVRLEAQYRDVLSSYGLPKTMFDSPADYGKFIGGGVSVNEVTDRVIAAKQMLDSSNPSVLRALQSYYGVGKDTALAYLLDADKAQDVIRQQVRQAQIGGMANQYGFNVDAQEAAQYAGSATGQAFDPFDTRTSGKLGDVFQSAAEIARRESVLAGIDREAYSSDDALGAVFGDQKKALASRKRAERERARFAGSSAATNTSLGVERNL